MESFNQRISIRCFPRAMSQNETMLFVLAQMQLAGRDGREIFQPSALEKIHSFSGGIPRVICQLCDNALRFAAREKRSPIDGPLIESSWYDLQQLPPPESPSGSTSQGTKSTRESVIEFGSLSDEKPNMPVQWSTSGSSEQTFHEASATTREFHQPDDNWPEPDSMDSMDDGSHIDDDGYFVTETEAHTEVDATLQTLLQQLDEYEVAEKEKADCGNKPVSRRTGDTTTQVEVDVARPAHQRADTSGGPVDTSSVFGNDYEIEEDVVDIQSLRISSQNRASARTSSIDVSGIVEPDSAPPWTPVGNEIVFPFGAEPQDHESETDATGHAKPNKSRRRDDALPTAEPRVKSSDTGADDDRDMIIVQESRQSKLDDASVDSNSAEMPPANPAPTGNVIRMNYQELFRQLRNNTDVEQ